jgi:hypothetical protein
MPSVVMPIVLAPPIRIEKHLDDFNEPPQMTFFVLITFS